MISFLCLSCFALLLGSASAYIGPDGLCRIAVFAPFTNQNGGPHRTLPFDNQLTVGFSDMAAALLAVDHFNERNVSMVPQLANLTSCNIRLNISKVFDSKGDSSSAGTQFWEYVTLGSVDPRNVCAIAGPAFDQPTADLGVMANANKIPLVSIFTEKIIRDTNNRLITSVFPDLMENALFVATNLLYKKRNNYIAFLHPFSDKGMQARSAIGVYFDNKNVRWMSSSFVETKDGIITINGTESLITQTVWEAVRRIKLTGYRTVLISMDNPEWSLQQIADALDFFGMNTGDYLYVFFDHDIIYLRNQIASQNVNLTRMFNGAFIVLPVSRTSLDLGPLNASGWVGLGEAALVERLNTLNPLNPANPVYMHANSSLFDPANYNLTGPVFGAAFAYDAVMAIGIGACEAEKQPNGSVDGIDHHEGIRKSRFLGASGFVEFGRQALDRGGTRVGDTLDWAGINFFNHTALPTELLLAGSLAALINVWDMFSFDHIVSFWLPTEFPSRYADGSSNPPLPLRAPGDQNYLNPGLRATGLVLMSLTIFISVLFGAWVYLYRKHRVLAASQPIFLYVICGGVIVEALSILAISFDESYGLNQDQLSALCMTLPWLLSTGFLVVTSALFTKLWRVHRILQFSRRQVKLTQIAWPMALLVSAALLVLTLWTALDPLQWKREEVDETTGESVGSCGAGSGNLAAYLAPLCFVALAALFLMAFMAYRTRDVDEAYSESTWILIMIVIQVEVCLVASPVIVRLHDENPNINYLVLAMVLLSFPWSTLGLIFIPKAVTFTKAIRGTETQQKRGQHSRTARVTGLDFPETEKSLDITGTVQMIPEKSSNRIAGGDN